MDSGHKQGATHDIPLRHAALVMSHLGIVGSGGEFFQQPAGKLAAAEIGRPTAQG
jgi:hypothetical protein